MTTSPETLKDAGLKVTHPRSKILDILRLHPSDHLSAEQIHLKLVNDNESIGLATVYRVLTQLEMAGLISKNQFSETEHSYEIKKSHHDHMICTSCGGIIEFVNADLEKLQEKMANKFDFTLTSHVMTLFGVCKDCNKKS